jgi:hypothetical protein
MHAVAPKTGNPWAAVSARFPAANQLAHCKRRIPNYLPTRSGANAAISRDKSPISPWIVSAAASGRPAWLLSSPKRFREKSNSNLPNKMPSRLAAPAEEAHETRA